MSKTSFPLILGVCVLTVTAGVETSPGQGPEGVSPLPGTEPLVWQGDIASRLVDGVEGQRRDDRQQRESWDGKWEKEAGRGDDREEQPVGRDCVRSHNPAHLGACFGESGAF